MIEISNANNKPVQRFLGYFLRSVERSAKLAKVYMRLCVNCHFLVSMETSERKLRLSYGDLGTRELETKARFKRRATAVPS